MSTTNCPKCGFQQEGGEECLRCGIIFARYRAASAVPPPQMVESHPARPSVWRILWNVFSWGSLVFLILTLVLILIPSSPPKIEVPPDAALRTETKVQEFRASLDQGRESTLEMDQLELNAWLSENLALKHPAGSPAASPLANQTPMSLAKKALTLHQAQNPTVQEVQSSVRDVKIELREDSLRAYVSFDLYGKELSLELEGRVSLRDGCLLLEPTAGKLGSLPLMAGTLEAAAHRLFESPENKEKFRLPPEIQDVAIKQGHLVISSR